MKAIEHFLVVALLGATMTQAVSQVLVSNPTTYRAYLEPTAAEAIRAWETATETAQSKMDKEPASEEGRFNLALIQYGLLNATMRYRNEEMFNRHIESTISNLETIKGPHAAEAKAILAAVYGLQLAYSPAKGMFLGPRISALLNKALREDNKSPLVWKLYANSKLHTPEAYGGDVEEAIEAYGKSVALYEAANTTKDNWLYIDALAFQGQAYARLGDSQHAISTYEKALKVEPSFNWVKYKLLPAAQKTQP